MPAEGLQWLNQADVLSAGEIVRVARLLVQYGGITSVRLTGGEPTVRADLLEIVEQLSQLGVDLSLTTNGTRLVKLAERLKVAGLNRMNISIDSLQPQRFAELTHRDQCEQVLDGINAAVGAGFSAVKLNVVLMRGINDDEILDFLHFGRKHGVIVRFIEFMPLDAHDKWNETLVVPEREILATAGEVFAFTRGERGSAPSSRFFYNDGVGEFGVISSVSAPFCDSCDRIRLTSDGQLRNCLFATRHLDVKSLLRSDTDNETIIQAIRGEVQKKEAGHNIGNVYFVKPSKSMSQIGG